MRQLIAGNWKMNGSLDLLAGFADLNTPSGALSPEVLLCLPAALVAAGRDKLADIALGGQDCHANASGAHTGDTSAALLAELGVSYCIVGHSERRTDHGEGDGDVKAKAQAAVNAGLAPIVCVGETLVQREAGQAEAVVRAQLAGSLPDNRSGLVVAYEPVWAIGTGAVATPEDVSVMHAMIRANVGAGVRILYGGSMKPSNAEELLRISDVDGGLIGGASLKAADFQAIIDSAVSIAG